MAVTAGRPAVIAEPELADLAAVVRDAAARNEALRIVGGGTVAALDVLVVKQVVPLLEHDALLVHAGRLVEERVEDLHDRLVDCDRA